MSGSLLKFEKRYSIKIGGRRYPAVKIGNQLWMAENLDYKFDVNGSQIPLGQWGPPTTPAAWYYNNNETDYGIDGTYKCGLLYNWYAAKYLEDNKLTLLPDGWHVPTKDEYEILITITEGLASKLKALDNSITSNWPSGWNGTDDYGFCVIPSGNHYNNVFDSFGTFAGFAEMTPKVGTNYYYRLVFGPSSMNSESYYAKTDCTYIRLVKSLE